MHKQSASTWDFWACFDRLPFGYLQETRADYQWTDVTGMLWAVSQAAPVRRIVVTNNLKFFEYRGGNAAGYGSGGFMADSVVKGCVTQAVCRCL